MCAHILTPTLHIYCKCGLIFQFLSLWPRLLPVPQADWEELGITEDASTPHFPTPFLKGWHLIQTRNIEPLPNWLHIIPEDKTSVLDSVFKSS